MPGKSTGRKNRTFGTQTSGQEREVCAGQEKGVQVGTYPSLAEKASVTMQKGMQDAFPKMTKSREEVYLFMRGKKELVQRLKNAFVKEKRIVGSYGGEYIGISEDLKYYEGDMYKSLPERCIIIIKFNSMKNAERWSFSSGNFKQKDFPTPADEMEIFAVPVSYLPNEDLTAFQLTEMRGFQVSPTDFDSHYVKPVARLLNSKRVYHGVVASPEVNRLRSCMIRPDTFILLHCADSESKLRECYDSAEYRQFKEFRQQYVAETNTCFFTLNQMTSK